MKQKNAWTGLLKMTKPAICQDAPLREGEERCGGSMPGLQRATTTFCASLIREGQPTTDMQHEATHQTQKSEIVCEIIKTSHTCSTVKKCARMKLVALVAAEKMGSGITDTSRPAALSRSTTAAAPAKVNHSRETIVTTEQQMWVWASNLDG